MAVEIITQMQPDTSETTIQTQSHTSGTRPASDPEPCPTRLLPDTPSASDGIDPHSPHRRVAKAIAGLLCNEDGGISVGIEGSWGAGKTSVVRLLREELMGMANVVEPSAGKNDAKKAAGKKGAAKGAEAGGAGGGAGRPAAPGKKDLDFALISFDAWAHEKDPLRRTFLEKVIPYLHDIEWVRLPEWRNRLLIISQRREEKTTSTQHRVKLWGALVALSVLCVPIGTAMLTSSSAGVKTLYDPSLPLVTKFAEGAALALAPVIMLLLALLHWCLKWLWRRLKPHVLGGADAEAGKPDGSPWSMFFNKGVESETTVTNKTPNPTSVEFEQEFSELMQEALAGVPAGISGAFAQKFYDLMREVLVGVPAGKSGAAAPADAAKYARRRVVLILDNLDRVDAADALTIWSTLQTFLGNPKAHEQEWFKHLWVVVLYDPRGISALWDKEEKQAGAGAARAGDAGRQQQPSPEDAEGRGRAQGEAARQGEGEDADAARDDGAGGPEVSAGKPAAAPAAAGSAAAAGAAEPAAGAPAPDSTATSFIDKSFQVRFEVPPPVLSEWRESLQKYLAVAVSGHVEEFEEVHRVYARHMAETGRYPTYRELKLFVNQIGALHRQWAHNCRPETRLPGFEAEEPMPLSHIAYYVLLRRRGVDVARRLTEGILPEDGYKHIVGEQADETLASLAFNVRRKVARQIIHRDPIMMALRLGDEEGGKRLLALEAANDAFWDTLREVVDPTSDDKNAEEKRSGEWVNTATLTLLAGGLIDRTPPHPRAAGVVRTLCATAAEVSEWPALGTSGAAAAAALFRWRRELGVRPVSGRNRRPFEENVLAAAARGLKADGQPGQSVAAAASWFEGLKLASAAGAKGQDDAGRSSLTAAAVRPLAEQFVPIRVRSSDGKPGHRALSPARLALLAEATLLLKGAAPQPTHEQLVKTAAAGHFLHHFSTLLGGISNEEEKAEVTPAITRLMLLQLDADPNFAEGLKWEGMAKEGAEALEKLIDSGDDQLAADLVALLDAHGRVPFLFELWDRAASQNLYRDLFRHCLDEVLKNKERTRKLFDPKSLVERWPLVHHLIAGYKRPVNNSLKGLVGAMPPAELSAAVSEFAAGRQLTDDVQYPRLYAEVVKLPESSAALGPLEDEWAAQLMHVDEQSWAEEISEWGGLYELLFALREKRQLSEQPGSDDDLLPEHYPAAVLRHAQRVLRKEQSYWLPESRRPTLPLAGPVAAAVFDQIYEAARQRPGDIRSKFLRLYDDVMSDPARLAADGFPAILEPLVSKLDVEEASWMKEIFERHPRLLEGNPGWAFKRKLADMLSSEPTEARAEYLYALAVATGAELPGKLAEWPPPEPWNLDAFKSLYGSEPLARAVFRRLGEEGNYFNRGDPHFLWPEQLDPQIYAARLREREAEKKGEGEKKEEAEPQEPDIGS